MRSLWRALALGLCLLAVPALPRAAPAATLADALQQARTAPTVKQALDRIAGAEAIARGMTGAARAFALADIERTRGQILVEAWRREPARTAERDQGRKALLIACDQYDALAKQYDDVVARMEAKLGDAELAVNREYKEASGSVSRARYAKAWAQYNVATSFEGGKERQKYFEEAAGGFEEFMAEGYKNHPIIAECFLGKALCLYELKRPADVLATLEPANRTNTPPDTFKQMTYLRVKALQDTNSPGKAEAAAAEYLSPLLAAGRRLDPVELGIALEQARCLVPLADPKTNPTAYRDFQGRLARLKKEIYDHYGEPWTGELAKVLGEAPPPSATKELAAAKSAFDARNYPEAIAAADTGLRAAAGKTGKFVADLYYIRLAALWNLQQWRDAHGAAFQFLRAFPKDERGPDVCRRALQAGLKALKGAPAACADGSPALTQAEFDRFLAFARQAYPTDPEIQKLPLFKANQLLAARQYREAETAAQAIPAASPQYRAAQYLAALAAYKQAEEAAEPGKMDRTLLVAHLGRTVTAVERFIEASRTALSEDDRKLAEGIVTLAVAAAQRLLDLPDPHPKTAQALLDRLEGWSALGALAAEQRAALRLSLTLRSGKLDEVLQQIDATLAKTRPQDTHAAQAIIRVADPLEKQSQRSLQAGDPLTARRVDDRLLKVYNFLLDAARLSTDPAFRNQEIAIRRRLAPLLLRLGRAADAVSHYEFLREKVPQEKAGDILRGLGLAYEKLGRSEMAIDLWRLLATGLKQDTEDWFEARWHLIRSYWEAGQQDHARKLIEYFRLQYPQGAPGQWKTPFEELYRKMELSAGTRR